MILIAKPKPIFQGSDRVFRGGSWDYDGVICQAAYRSRIAPAYRFNFIGFRLALRKKI